MKTSFPCILCPNSCDLEIEYCMEKQTVSVTGNRCSKGKFYAKQEIFSPIRTITAVVPVSDADRPVISVRLTKAIPKGRIFDAMAEINRLRPKAPVRMGMVLIRNLLGYDSDVIATQSAELLPDERPSFET